MRTDRLTGLLATAALASWTVPLWCIELRSGAHTLTDAVLPLLLGVGVVSVTLRLLLHRYPGDFGIFFPARNYPQGTARSIRWIAALLLVFDLGAAWFVLRSSLSRTTTDLMAVLATVSAMNLADECWIARRRRGSRP